uniref:Uncharacterized protein n=1 Tax=Glossina austeni TaxID=7395 RepID=A0A1A9VH11_GLOAU
MIATSHTVIGSVNSFPDVDLNQTCCIIGILALDFVLAKPWCDGLNVRYWFIRGQDLLDSGVQLLHYTNTTHLYTHINLLNQPGSNNVTVLIIFYLNYRYITTTELLVYIFIIVTFKFSNNLKVCCGEEDLPICQTESVLICSICRNELDSKRSFCRTIWYHIFRRSCLKPSLNNSQLYPNCQTNLPVEHIFGQILTRQQTRLLDSNKADMGNTLDPPPQLQSLSPELTQQISEMSSVQAQQSKFLKSLSVTMSEMVQKNIEEGLRKINLPTTSSMSNQTQSQSYFNLDFNRTESISQQPLDQRQFEAIKIEIVIVNN